ncbi:0c29729e-8d01-478e-a183-2af85560979f [Thermothielavioides terrestris]|uniref:0c29729e-8d01-478e-a183-2af85560979f n=1 Tax=Thermothielavioides terrestris TaxID=2587410 RepID=A0A446BLP5_9PEZI|nr:0c29729e-8d01-478e-a183-2af85560979f [Thermothielavioides terrestris]
MGDSQPRKAQVIRAPFRPIVTYHTSVFLAGTTSSTSGPDWRQTLTDAISLLPVTVFNPLRPDWDSTWREDPEFEPFREQVQWELDMQEKADVVVVYFGPGTDAPISLLELGLCARAGKGVVACHKEYRKRGNVLMVCQRFGLDVVDNVDDLASTLVRKLEGLLGPAAQGR